MKMRNKQGILRADYATQPRLEWHLPTNTIVTLSEFYVLGNLRVKKT